MKTPHVNNWATRNGALFYENEKVTDMFKLVAYLNKFEKTRAEMGETLKKLEGGGE